MADNGPEPRAPRSHDLYVTGVRWWNRWLYWLYERRLLARVKGDRVPQHLGIIMDGNRRFARSLGLDPKAGHDYGAGKARDVLNWCLELGIRHVTLWGFSTENRGRSQDEVSHLYRIFAAQAREFLLDTELHKRRVRVRVIGNIDDFPTDAKAALREMEAATAGYDALHLHVALGYGGREEIVTAVRATLRERAQRGEELATVAETIDAADIDAHLYTAGIPDPDFVVRTSGEVRSSGFLLWQSAYAEFYFCDAFWPEFRRIDFLRAIRSFQQRQRRFGR